MRLLDIKDFRSYNTSSTTFTFSYYANTITFPLHRVKIIRQHPIKYRLDSTVADNNELNKYL